MSSDYTWKSLIRGLLIGAAAAGMAGASFAAQQHTPTKAVTRKAATKKAAPPVPLPSGPTGPMQPMPLDSIAAVPPQVTYQNNQLTIVAPNSTLGDILRAVRKQTGADIDVPQAPERVVTHLGPGPARDVIAELLNGSRFNYVLLSSAGNDSVLTRVVLVAKGGIQDITANPGNTEANRGLVQPNGMVPPQQESPDMNDQEPPLVEDNASNVPDEPAPEPPPTEADQSSDPNGNGVKTPQQMLQEMQQRQMQLQQQQQNGGGLGPSGMPPHPPRQE